MSTIAPYRIRTTVTLTSPMNVSSEVTWYLDSNERLTRVKPGGSDDSKHAVAGTMTQHVILPRSGRIAEVPYYPANGIRGRLRRKAAARLFDAITRVHGRNRLPVVAYAGLVAGAATGRPDVAAQSVEEILRARSHVYMGIFGGGARMLRSRFSVTDMIPVSRAFAEEGLVPEELVERALPSTDILDDGSEAGGIQDAGKDKEGKGALRRASRYLGVWHWCDWRHFVRVDDVIRVIRPDEMMKVLDGAERAIADWVEQTRKQKDAVKEGDKNYVLANIQRIMTVRAGTPLMLNIEWAADATPAQTGLILLALRDFINDQGLGGWKRAGFGRFRVDSQAAMETPDDEKLPLFDEVSSDPYRVELSDAVSGFVKAATEELEALDIDELVSFFVDKPADDDDGGNGRRRARGRRKTADEEA